MKCVLSGGTPTPAGTSMFLYVEFFCIQIECEAENNGDVGVEHLMGVGHLMGVAFMAQMGGIVMGGVVKG